MNKVVFVFIAILFLTLQKETTGLNCYVCSAGTDGCGAKFSSTGGGVWTGSMVSSASATACQKVVYDTNMNAQSRSASTSCTAGSSTTAGGTAVTTYCCTTDLCNKAQPMTAGFVLAIIIALISVWLVK